MSIKKAQTTDTNNIEIEELSEKVGGASEMPAADRARLQMAYFVLGGVFALFLLSGVSLLFIRDEYLQRAQQIFDFVKGFGPPLITLVLGFYFRDAVDSSS